MVAKRIELRTRRAGEAEGWGWRSEGGGHYEIFPLAEAPPRGTSVVLHLAEGAQDYLEEARLERIIRAWCDHVAFPVRLAGRRINRDGALWRRPESEVSQDQYAEFYRSLSHALDEPWRRIRFSAEGLVSFTALLFIPTLRPFDLFDPARATHLKLYVRRVFIAETGHGLLPPWLRFLRGVVDSEDLPLNISREMLQQDDAIARLRDALVKRVLRELEGAAKEDPAAFADFWSLFGPVMKEGVYEDDGFARRILKLARFASTKSAFAGAGTEGGDEPGVSLDEYCARMAGAQEAIWYLAGEDAAQLARNPRLEACGPRARKSSSLLTPSTSSGPRSSARGRARRCARSARRKERALRRQKRHGAKRGAKRRARRARAMRRQRGASWPRSWRPCKRPLRARSRACA